MKTWSGWIGCNVVLLSFLASPPLVAGATIEKQADGSHRVIAETYEAVVDGSGDLVFLSSRGQEFFTQPKPPEDWVKARGDKPVSVNLTANLLAIRNDHRKVEFTFGPHTIGVDHEGALPWYGLSPQLTGQVTRQGHAKAAGAVAPNVVKLIHGSEAIAISEPMHTMRGLIPSKIPEGKAKETSRFQYTIETGMGATAADQISIVTFDGLGADKTAPSFARGTPPEVFAVFANLSNEPVQASARVLVEDHHTNPTEVFSATKDFSIEGGEKMQINFPLEVSEPGIYNVRLELLSNDTVVSRQRLGIMVAPEHYKPPLTRPLDFEDFWADQLARARSVPINPQVTKNPQRSTDQYDYFDLRLELLPGRVFSTAMVVPKQGGSADARVIFSREGNDPSNELHKIFESLSAPAIVVSCPMPEEGTFRRWTSATDNNLLECYLITVRTLDFVRSLEGVERIQMSGNSRSGPLVLVAAALSPEKVVAVHSHVPTCMGLSWADKVYRGWGQAPADKLDAAAYVDPVNFAPNIRVPFWLNGGTEDSLAYPQGMLAFYNHATQAPWKRIAVERGGHGFFTSDRQRTFLAELSDYLKTDASNTVDERILREH